MTNPSIESRADEPAAMWLALADAGDGTGSWAAAGTVFRTAITAEDWTAQLRAARSPLGPLTSRVLAVAQAFDGLPSAPPGEYVVRQYHSVYDARKAVVETLTLRREDGEWRVVGYFIR